MRRPLCTALLVFLACYLAAALLLPGAPLPEYGDREGEALKLAGKVSKPYSPADGTREGQFFSLSDIQVFSESESQLFPASGNYFVLCYLQDGEEMPRAGSRVLASGELWPFREATNPGEFDASAYYARKGYLFSLREAEIVRESMDYGKVAQALASLRHWADRFFYRALGGEDAGIASAMVLGIKKGMDEEVKALYAGAGISHLLAISGLHLSLIGMGAFGLLRRLRLPVAVSAGASALFLYAYAWMVEMSVSTRRALVMFCLLLGARLAKRTTDLPTSLAVAACVILVPAPQEALDAGFQLSFSAVLGIALVVPVLTRERERAQEKRTGTGGRGKGAGKRCFLTGKRIGESRPVWALRQLVWTKNAWAARLPGPVKRLGLTLYQSAAASFGITLAMLPFLLAHYYEWSPWSVAANLAVIPLMGILLPLLLLLLAVGGVGSLAPALGPVLLPAVWGLEWSCARILDLYEGICRLILLLPGSTQHTGFPAPWAMAAYGIGLGLLVRGGGRLGRKTRLAAAVCLSTIFLWRLPGDLRITMLDVGQGLSVCVETPEHGVYLMDAGSTSKRDVGQYQVVPYLKYIGTRRIEGIFISHWDEDHVNGLEDVLAWAKLGHVPVKRLFLPDTALADGKLSELLALAETYRVPVERLSAGEKTKDSGLRLTCLHPEAGSTPGSRNDSSLVLRLDYRDFSALFMGDLEQEGEQRLLEEKGERTLAAQLLIAGHHGSSNASGEAFLDQVSPRLAWISCGKNNRYGHPSPETEKRLGERDIPEKVTAREGAQTIVVGR
ncbi:MAG: ComEC/Rec2 family competence protein [Eubacteriales bacterium]|nr:ComEC/Rec2 family competence protein [Eubacteriales bacterium]